MRRPPTTSSLRTRTPPRRDGAHCQLLVARDAELADEKNVQGCAERASHFVRDGHAAAREGQNEHVGPIGVGGELLGEHPARLAAITIGSWLHASTCPQYRSPIEPSASSRCSTPAIRGAIEMTD
jgi:hypothetical protein